MPSTRIPKSALLIAIAVLYSAAHLAWYLETPFGLSPVLDGRENLILAQQIEDGTLARESFYRAMLYPAILAYLPVGHSLLGLLCHALNTVLAFAIARRFWKEERAGLISGALVGLNPVLLHFAFDPLDTTLAITLFLSALSALQRGFSNEPTDTNKNALFLITGLAISLAALARPHFLITIIIITSLLTIACVKRRLSPIQLGVYALACLVPLLAYGFVQKSWSGNFQVLPWQGAYNLWISNNSTANGLYYQQTVSFHHLDPHQNPNRMEANYFFEKENGHRGSIEEQKSYWRDKTLNHVAESPFSWIKLEAFKLYAIFNNFEQYNNKTYSFHKALSPWLRYNPICWGLLLASATFCVTVLWRQKRAELLPSAAIALSIVAGLLLYMASARFRLPLTPMLAILAGGLPLSVNVFSKSSDRLRYTAIVSTLIVIILSFSRFSGIASERTYTQDALLLADAAARIGDDSQAIEWSTYVLDQNPDQQNALRLQLISRYNQIASGTREGNPSEWNKLNDFAQALQLQDELLGFIRGVVLWNIGHRKEAKAKWEGAIETYGPKASASLAALLVTGHSMRVDTLPHPLEAYLAEGNHRLLAYALARGLAPNEQQILMMQLGLTPETYHSIGKSFERILPIP